MDETEGQVQIRRSERERYLEDFVHEVGGSPAFVFAISPSEVDRFTEADFIRAIKIKNALQEDKNALVTIHREAQTLHITGVLLKPHALTKLAQVKDSFSESGIECNFAMSIPEEGDVQSVTVVDGHSTTYGASVLALARAEKVSVAPGEEMDVFQLAKSTDEGAFESDKGTYLRKIKLEPEKIKWATQEQINMLPEPLFEQIDLNTPLKVIEVDLSEFQFLKPDINDSGEKIVRFTVGGDTEEKNKEAVEDRQLVVAANFKLLTNISEYVESYEEVYVTSRLGDSIVFIMKREADDESHPPEKIFRIAVSSLAERGVDLFVEDEKVKDDTSQKEESSEKDTKTFVTGSRAESLGHLSTVELPIQSEKVKIYKIGREVLFDRLWNPEGEKRLEMHHKDKGLTPSQIVRIADLN